MKNLIIIGARGFGREIYRHATNCKGFRSIFLVKGFLDDRSGNFKQYEAFPPVIDSVENYQPKKNDRFICALGNVADKIKYCKMILGKGGEFTSLVHPTAYIEPASRIGIGSIIMADVRISTEVEIGDFSTIMVRTLIGHDAIIGDWVHIGPNSFIGGGAFLDDEAQIHVNSTIMSKIRIGKGAVTGAGSVVIKNVKPGITVFGNPAKEIGKFKK